MFSLGSGPFVMAETYILTFFSSWYLVTVDTFPSFIRIAYKHDFVLLTCFRRERITPPSWKTWLVNFCLLYVCHWCWHYHSQILNNMWTHLCGNTGACEYLSRKLTEVLVWPSYFFWIYIPDKRNILYIHIFVVIIIIIRTHPAMGSV